MTTILRKLIAETADANDKKDDLVNQLNEKLSPIKTGLMCVLHENFIHIFTTERNDGENLSFEFVMDFPFDKQGNISKPNKVKGFSEQEVEKIKAVVATWAQQIPPEQQQYVEFPHPAVQMPSGNHVKNTTKEFGVYLYSEKDKSKCDFISILDDTYKLPRWMRSLDDDLIINIVTLTRDAEQTAHNEGFAKGKDQGIEEVAFYAQIINGRGIK